MYDNNINNTKQSNMIATVFVLDSDPVEDTHIDCRI